MTDPKDQEPADSEDAGNAESAASDASSSADAAGQSTDDDTATTADQDAEATENAAAGEDADQSETGSEEAGSESDTDPDEDLPDWEPLSPEIVEDEAIRGDFMLRWAVVLLAFLLGFRHISETVTLVRIRTGEHLAANGVLPPATDVFSYTAAEQPWVNLGWLFDLLIAGLHGAGGPAALTLFTALAAGVTFYFLHGITRDDTPTWWTSVCAGTALLMAALQFTALPQLITLLGTAWMLRGLYAWSQTGKQSTLWCLVISLAVWSNLDPRAFIGWMILAAFLAGTSIGRKIGRGGHHADASLKDLAIATGVGFVALMIHPFGWHAILSPIQLYGVEIPALAEYAGRIRLPHEVQVVSLFDAAVWENLNQHTIAALVIAAAAIITSIMNASRLDVGLLLAFVVTLGLSMMCSHELGTVALVACVLASLNGQDWYRANCRQEYTIETFEVLWSRLGRAVTVIGIAAIAFLAISGRLMGPDGRRVGLGFAPWFAAAIEATADELESLPDGRIFTFRLDQSDLLLWHGVPTFVDSRVGIFAGGEDDILRIHNQARYALRQGAVKPQVAGQSTDDSTAAGSGSKTDAWRGKREFWEVPFERFQVELITPRMWGVTPDYSSYFDLTASADWNLVELGATTAFFSRADPKATPESLGPASELFRKRAFEDCRVNSDVDPRVEWPRPASSYQRFLSLPERPHSNFSQRAQHELAYLTAGVNGVFPMERDDAIGLAVLALRDAAAGASEESDNSRIFRMQADTYGVLGGIEASIMAQYELAVPTQQRYYQRLFALRQALIVDPERLELLTNLADLYFSAGQSDLSLEMVERALTVIRSLPESSFNDQTLQLARRLNQVKQQIAPQIETLESRLDEMRLQEGFEPVQVAAALQQGGYSAHALAILEEDRILMADNLPAQVQLASLLAESGRLEEAANMFDSFEELATSASGVVLPISVVLQASWLDSALGDNNRVERRCSRHLEELQKASTQAMLATVPFSMPTPQFLGESNIWPATQTLVASRTLNETAAEIAVLQWTLAMAHIEGGKCVEAVAMLKDLVEAYPESSFRPLVKVWLKAMTGEEITDQPPELDRGILFNDDSDMIDRVKLAAEAAAAAAAEEKAKASEDGAAASGKPADGESGVGTPANDKPADADRPKN